MALGVAFLTLALPLALNGRWSAASWALEGTALIWVGCRQHRLLPRSFGTLLQLAAGAYSRFDQPVGTGGAASGTFIAALMVGVASACAAQILHANRQKLADYEATFAGGLFLSGIAVVVHRRCQQDERHVDKSYLLASTLAFATVTALLCAALARRFRLTIALPPALSLMPVMALFALWAASTLPHPLAQAGWISWPVSFAALYAILRLHDDAPLPSRPEYAARLYAVAADGSIELGSRVGDRARGRPRRSLVDRNLGRSTSSSTGRVATGHRQNEVAPAAAAHSLPRRRHVAD